MKKTYVARILLVIVLVCALVLCFAEGMYIHEEQGSIHPIETVTSEFVSVINGTHVSSAHHGEENATDGAGASNSEETSLDDADEGEVA